MGEAEEARAALTRGAGPGLLDDEGDDDRDNERVNRDRLGERGADDHRGADVAGGFGVAAERFHRTANRHTDTDAGADRAETDRERGSDRLGSTNRIRTRSSRKHRDPPS